MTRKTYKSRSNAHRAARNAAMASLGPYFQAFEGPDYAIHPTSSPFERTRWYYELRGPAKDSADKENDQCKSA